VLLPGEAAPESAKPPAKKWKTLSGTAGPPNPRVSTEIRCRKSLTGTNIWGWWLTLAIPAEIRTPEDLLGPGAKPGTVPTDLEQSTGLERLEILGKMEGIDIFDMRPLDASRKGASDPPLATRKDERETLGEIRLTGDYGKERSITRSWCDRLVTSSTLAAPATLPTRTRWSGSVYVSTSLLFPRTAIFGIQL